MTELTGIVVAIADFANVVSKLVNKQGIFVLLQLAGPMGALSGVDWTKVKGEVSTLSSADRKALETAFETEFKPVNPIVGAKVDQFIALAEASITEILKDVSVGTEAYASVQKLVEQWKVVFS